MKTKILITFLFLLISGSTCFAASERVDYTADGEGSDAVDRLDEIKVGVSQSDKMIGGYMQQIPVDIRKTLIPSQFSCNNIKRFDTILICAAIDVVTVADQL
jgi:hypothetical protein